MNPHLSVVIPVFNESDRLGPTLAACHDYLSAQSYAYEMIIVDDGSTDDSVVLVEQYQSQFPNLTLLRLPKNEGKGSAVRTGMLAAKGEYRLFMDADNSTSIEQIEKLLPYLSQGCDIAVGSRRIKGSVVKTRQNFLRDFLGWIFRVLVKVLTPTSVWDTQNGFKLFSAKAAENVFSQLKIQSWSFDVEVLLLAQKMSYKIKEVSIVWINDGRSKVRFPQMVGMLLDLVFLSARKALSSL